ncbi:D-alanyl-D-alanine carboxypeptidase family protein [Pelagibius sp. CAU 1746]|uniref:D-alanyl-D-alanine carboxypeptidase family protein n=1 Tax=Pelagibius sp. CAU 1746 TaxID=3140370 RepID=UPI00325BCC5C
MRNGWGRAVLTAVALWCSVAAAGSVRAESAWLLVEAETGAVLAQQQATRPWYPASVTKAMTAYMVFEALAEGRLTLDRKITVSGHAAAQPPTRLGLHSGQKVAVRQLLQAMIVRSANDAAVALAEAISGSEAAFAATMTRRAQALGMSQTVFANPTGLPDPAQVTTARDLVILARALIRDHPQHFGLFSKSFVSVGGLGGGSTNGWKSGYPGAEGIKTGFTCGSGYNLLAAATRDGRRLIGVVLGGVTGGQRNARMTRLMNDGFARPAAGPALTLDDLPRRAAGSAPYVLPGPRCPVSQNAKTADLMDGELPGWGLVFGSFVSKDQANSRIAENRAAIKDVVSGGQSAVIARTSLATHRYSALLVDLDRQEAGSACRRLQELSVYCLAVPPKLLNNPQALWR